MEVVRETTVFSDQIDEHAVVGEPRPVNGKRIEFVVRITEVVIGRSVGVGEGAANLPIADLIIGADLYGRALTRDVAEFLF